MHILNTGNETKYRVPTIMEKSWKMTGHGKVMEKSWKIIGHGLMEKSWNSVNHGKSLGKPKFGQIYFVDFVELCVSVTLI